MAAAADEPRYAIDTEFHRERTYFPQVALVQLRWAQETVLIDPLEVDLQAMSPLLEGDGLCILHAGVQDLEVLELATGTVPRTLLDTQIAAGFLGVPTGSLLSVLDRYLGVKVAKGDRLTDWMRRPLTADQRRYAASDVDHLLDLTDILSAELAELGRMEWALAESQLLLDRPRTRRTPEEAVARIKEARSLKGRQRAVATAVAGWRENRAAEVDLPVRQVLPDIAVVAISQQAPRSTEALAKLRGVDGRHTRSEVAKAIIAAVDEGLDAPKPPPRDRGVELPKELRPVVTLVTSWISQLARDHRLDPALLATRSDVENLLKRVPGRLDEGWRAELVGDPVHALVEGHAAIAFDREGRLVLEERSGTQYQPSSNGSS